MRAITKLQIPNSNQAPNSNESKVFDMGERTAVFGEKLVRFATSVPKTQVAAPIIGQLVRSGTSIGANYMEASEAESRRDFCHKVSIAKKEAKETLHWLRMLAAAEPTAGDTCRELWREVHELTLILATMQRNARTGEPKTPQPE